MQVTKHIDLPMWTVYVIQYAVFGTGLLGITYGILSARYFRLSSCLYLQMLTCLDASGQLAVPWLTATMLCSWDPEREGSFLGVNEFKGNLPVFLNKIRGRS